MIVRFLYFPCITTVSLCNSYSALRLHVQKSVQVIPVLNPILSHAFTYAYCHSTYVEDT